MDKLFILSMLSFHSASQARIDKTRTCAGDIRNALAIIRRIPFIRTRSATVTWPIMVERD
ncbi:hypothetical protein DPMN_044729 [Dreissena polymorpha]|uniref:Uncharacterized protein n=1 Tax=Dreissena polymorpha TaxID=45954 RepID=A0A9D4D2S3_DREPO|nr:hypothetical protein DPMN_044729 [Dreissena polymorpha]